MGRAVLASDVGGLAEVIKSGETGLLFKAGDINDLQDKLVYLINDEQKRSAIGTSAREWIRGETTGSAAIRPAWRWESNRGGCGQASS